MGMLEDLIMGLMGGGGQQQYRPLSPFSTASPEKEEEMRRYFAEHGLLGGMADEIAAKDVIGLSDTEIAGYQSGMTNIPTRADAQARFAEADAAIPAEPEETAEEKMKRLQQETNQRSLDSLTGGSGPDSGVSYPAGLLMAIRKQAKAKGEAGSLGADVSADVTLDDYLQPNVGAGGSFSQGANTPELQARLRERDEWTAQQPERDMEFLASAEQARRNPELAMASGESLTRMRKQRADDKRLANQETLIASLGKSGGKLPFKTAMQLSAAGLEPPWQMVGTSPDLAKKKIKDFVMEAQAKLQEIALDPMKGTEPGADQLAAFLQYMLSIAPQYDQLIDGGMDPDEAGERFFSIAQRHGQDSGAIGFLMQELQKQQAQPQE